MQSNRHNPIDIDNAPIKDVLAILEGQLMVLDIEGVNSELSTYGDYDTDCYGDMCEVSVWELTTNIFI